jgi:IS1 family transposase
MSVTGAEKRAEIIAHLVECGSVRGTARLCGVDKATVTSLLVKVGQGCERLHNRLVRGLAIHRIECDEIVTYVHTRQKNLRGDEPSEHGETWTYTGLATTSKLLIAYRTGKRTQDMTDAFMWDLRSRLTVMPEMVTDGLHCYAASVARSFNGAVDYAQLVKTPSRKGKTKPGVPFVVKRAMVGAPDMSRVSTSYVERHNGTIRDQIKRFTRRTRCHSKKLDNHCAAVALFVGWYNLVRHHESLKTTPAVAARLAEEPWTLSQLIEAALSEPLDYEAPKPAVLMPRPGSTAAARQTSTGTWLRAVPARGTPASDRATPVAPQLRKAIPKAKQLSLFPDDPA